jgi:hypothetical protein
MMFFSFSTFLSGYLSKQDKIYQRELFHLGAVLGANLLSREYDSFARR